MASAIIKGIIASKFVKSSQIIATKSSDKDIEAVSKSLGVEVITDNKFLIKKSDIIVIAVKPNQVGSVLSEIKEFVNDKKLIVSVAAGITTAFIENEIGGTPKVIRVMPNTPVLVNEGMSGLCAGKYATQEEIRYVSKIFDTIGKYIVVNETQMDIVTAISGSGPAFFYKVINDIARAGEKLGLEYDKSLLLSIQTAIGSAKMALNREISMEELISNVATKGGCTRVGVDVMETANIANILEKVIKDTAQKAHELGK
jgi:pyrroline-5-carboxylate reductase